MGSLHKTPEGANRGKGPVAAGQFARTTRDNACPEDLAEDNDWYAPPFSLLMGLLVRPRTQADSCRQRYRMRRSCLVGYETPVKCGLSAWPIKAKFINGHVDTPCVAWPDNEVIIIMI